MNIPIEFLLITSSIGAVQSGFFSLYLLSQPKKREISTRILGFLLLALAVRMAKSCGWYFSNDNLPAIIENIGYAAHLAIAPLLFLYVKSFVEENFEFKKTTLFHFTPTSVTLLFSPFLDDWFWLGSFSGYFLSLYYFGAYFPFIYFLIYKNRTISKEEKSWLFVLIIGVNLVWVAYAANFLLGLVSYITAPTLFSLVIYPISFFALKQHKVFVRTAKYQNSALTPEQIKVYGETVENLMKVEKIYRNSNLTLPKLAKRIDVSTQIASEIINRHFDKNFADFINSYRLEDAQEMLKDTRNRHKKIASIAFDCGYGTLSAFNTSFKKHTNLTPSDFKRRFGKR